ncbi:hypothetical protein N0V82_009100 [Gnomoniopsis sp. IMI 355080]|nr:hypothetical protein N0V82_009100 [Gnomoniopsis sp. IMI 355080]
MHLTQKLSSRITKVPNFVGRMSKEDTEHFQAGFVKNLVAKGAASEEWTCYVEYELLQISGWINEARWRQVALQLYDQTLEVPAIIQEPLNETDCRNWEVNAVATLAPALKTRRWLTQPDVSRIEVAMLWDILPDGRTFNQPNNPNEAEKPSQATRAVSEVDFDADEEALPGDSTPKFDSRAVLGNPAAVIPGTEAFDDIPSILRNISPKADPFDGDRLKMSGYRVGRKSPTNKPWATREQIASWTKRRSSGTISDDIPQASQVSSGADVQRLSRAVEDSASD